MSNIHRGAHFQQNRQYADCKFTWNAPSQNSSSIPKMNDYFKENSWIAASKDTVYSKDEDTIYKRVAYLQIKTLLQTLKS